jgi:PAS domain-containing protein
MAQRDIEVILLRQLASHLAVPMLVVDPNGNLLFFNEAAEPIIGRRFEETGEIRRGEWSTVFKPMDENGVPVAREEQPLFIATEERRPAHRRYWIHGLDDVTREIEGIAFPLVGQGERFAGAVGIFWEVRRS